MLPPYLPHSCRRSCHHVVVTLPSRCGHAADSAPTTPPSQLPTQLPPPDRCSCRHPIDAARCPSLARSCTLACCSAARRQHGYGRDSSSAPAAEVVHAAHHGQAARKRPHAALRSSPPRSPAVKRERVPAVDLRWSCPSQLPRRPRAAAAACPGGARPRSRHALTSACAVERGRPPARRHSQTDCQCCARARQMEIGSCQNHHLVVPRGVERCVLAAPPAIDAVLEANS